MQFHKKFRFSRKIFKEILILFRQFHKAIDFEDKFPKNFDFFQVISQTNSIFQDKFPKNFDFLCNFTINFDFLEKFRFFSGNFTNKLDLPRKSTKNFDFFWYFHKKILFSKQISEKNRFFRQFYWLFTAFFGQIILFLFKSHHFRTHFLYMIRYNNILRPVHDPTTPLRPTQRLPCGPPTTPCSKSGGVATPQP